MRTCETCNQKYTNGGKRFCSMSCYTTHKRANQTEITCFHCGSIRWVCSSKANRPYCSKRCYIESTNFASSRICKDCKKEKPIEEFNKHAKNKTIRRKYCIECELKRVRKQSRTPYGRWSHSVQRNSRTGQVWEIEFETFKQLISRNCHYCEGILNKTGCGLDRMNNSLGYTIDNVVPCCKQCNTVKNHFFTYEEMMLLSPTLIKIREEKISAYRE